MRAAQQRGGRCRRPVCMPGVRRLCLSSKCKLVIVCWVLSQLHCRSLTIALQKRCDILRSCTNWLCRRHSSSSKAPAAAAGAST